MRNIILSILSFVILLNLVYAAPPFSTISNTNGLLISPNIQDYLIKNTTYEFEIHVINDTKLINSGVTCNLHIYDKTNNGGHEYINTSNTVTNGYDIEMTTAPTVHLNKGEYSFKAFCNTSGQAGIYEKTYYVTNTGNPPADDFFTAIIYLLFIISTLGLFYIFLITLTKLAIGAVTVYDVIISWASYILLIFVNYLAMDYLLRTYLENLTNTFLTITVWTNGVFPAIAFAISLIIRALQKKKPLTIQEISGVRLSNG